MLTSFSLQSQTVPSSQSRLVGEPVPAARLALHFGVASKTLTNAKGQNAEVLKWPQTDKGKTKVCNGY
jgi:hypothetical protein